MHVPGVGGTLAGLGMDNSQGHLHLYMPDIESLHADLVMHTGRVQ